MSGDYTGQKAELDEPAVEDDPELDLDDSTIQIIFSRCAYQQNFGRQKQSLISLEIKKPGSRNLERPAIDPPKTVRKTVLAQELDKNLKNSLLRLRHHTTPKAKKTQESLGEKSGLPAIQDYHDRGW
ncbi:hypothetical protein HIM_09123 [Hirsutella minnesotensis 3608]|uniref:Uncharacterized protein n=1 Tax=Hirsutella minnesotensis 3608 TaxID=1043627 RepID=A0A0F8A3A4_9HYPO|nr:hypothetical protein HIM_09123 [Hirsutella minnesotensis 3608]